MKKTIAIFIALVMCFSFISSVGHVFAAKPAASLTVIDLVGLKKHIVARSTYNADFDYNEDKAVNSQDLTALMRILLGLPYTPDEPNIKEYFKFDNDGYYNKVVKT